MTKKLTVAVKLAEWMKGKLGTTAEYWETHLTKGGKIKLAKWVRLKREYEAYEKMIKEEYSDLLTTEAVVTKVVITEDKKRELLEYALKNDLLKAITIKDKEFEKLGMLKDCNTTSKTQQKMVAITTIEKFLEKAKEEEVQSELTA